MSTRPEDYNVGWICAIEPERIVACELLDEEYTGDNVPHIDSLRDHNIYTFGRIHKHKVVIASLPKGRYGISSATRVAEHMQSSFPALQLSLMVGIAGGVPSQKHDIRLGDVVVSCPTGKHCGVINYNFGVAVQHQEFEETGHLASPSNILLNALAALKARHKREGHNISSTITGMLEKNRRLRAEYSRPSARMDRLYESKYIHSNQEACDCQVLLENKDELDLDGNPYLVQRSLRGLDEDDPAIHYGLIASADQLIKDAILRDTLAQKHDVLCFEMEAAGLMNSDLRCLVIRGICDYADTHKNDAWQGYAAATAAAYAKEFLEIIPRSRPRLTATEKSMVPAGQFANNSSKSMQDSAGINIEIGPLDTQQSLIHPIQDNLNVNIFLAGIRNAFMKGLEAGRDARVNICIEIARQSDQLKTFVRVQQAGSTENQHKEQELDRDQVFLNCISRCAERKPSEAVQGFSRVFSGSADFSFERGSNFYPDQYSINQTLLDRIIFVASRESYSENGYSIELFLHYIVKRRRWQRVHMCITTAEKTGDLANIPISAPDWQGYSFWTPPQSFVLMLESILQDLELTGSVTKVDLPLHCNASRQFQYDFECVQATADYEQKDLLEKIEGDAIRHLRSIGCKQYQESQLTILGRRWADSFDVTDGSSDYIQCKAPFARTAWTLNEFESFIQQLTYAQSFSSCQGVARFVGVVLDDHRNHITGFLIESELYGLPQSISFALLKKFTIPRALRRLWAKQLIACVSDLHSRGAVIGTVGLRISSSLNIQQSYFLKTYRTIGHPTNGAVQAPGLGTNKDPALNHADLELKGDIFQLGYTLWRLSEHVPHSRRYLCVIAGCTTRPYYRCRDAKHQSPVSLPFSQHGDPVLREIIEDCRIEDPSKRPTAQELARRVTNEISFEENEIEISRQKKVFRTAMKELPHALGFTLCDECILPLFSYYSHCNICSGGDFDLCDSCIASGVHCWDSNHQLLKMRQDSLGNLIQEPHRPA